MKIKKTSWHYRLMRFFPDVSPMPISFCGYVKRLAVGLLGIIIAFSLILVGIGGVCYCMIRFVAWLLGYALGNATNPDFMIIMGVMFVVVSLGVVIYAISQSQLSWVLWLKSKTCPMIEYE